MDNTEFEKEEFIESYKQFIQEFEVPLDYQTTVLNVLLIAHTMNNLNDIPTTISIDYIEALIGELNNEKNS